MSSTTWKTLLERLGDRASKDWQESWCTFVELYRPLLTRYVQSITKTYGQAVVEADVEEVVQEIFIKLSSVMSPAVEDKLPDDGAASSNVKAAFALDHAKGRFRSWLYTVTKRKVLDHINKKKSGLKQLPEGEQFAHVEEPPEEWGRDYRARVLEFTLPEVKEVVSAKSWHCFEQYFLKNRKAVDIAMDAEVGGLTSNAVCVNALRVMEKVRAKCIEFMGELDNG